MKQATEAIYKVAEASGAIAKQRTLVTYADVPHFKEILRFIYNPYSKTGIAMNSLKKGYKMAHDASRCRVEPSLDDALKYFSTHCNGSNTDICYAWDFMDNMNKLHGADAANIAAAIVTKDLKIGVTATSLNKVYGDSFIPKIGCMLGTLYGDVKPEKVQWPCIVTEKLDGIRRILIKENGVIRCFSRSGHEDTGLVDIIKEAAYLPDNRVYDGELLAIGNFADNIALRQATSSIANSKGAKHNVSLNLFDSVPLDEFYAGKSKEGALNRKIWLGAVLGDDSISIIDDDWQRRIIAFNDHDYKLIRHVPILGRVQTINEVKPIVEKIWERKGEGVMLNTSEGLYEIKRSKELLKIKNTEEVILKVVDIMEGTGKYEGAAGCLLVDYKGMYVGVGSGLTDAQRINIWKHPEEYIGRKVEIETFGESVNAQGYVSLNCPILKRFVDEVE